MSEFDFKNPDYTPIFRQRIAALNRLRANPGALPAIKRYYKDNPGQFIHDWMITLDPKNLERGLPVMVPFLLFPRQREFVDEVMQHWKAGTPMLVEKTRQMGFSWLSMALSTTLGLFHDGMTIGVGSRKESYVDHIGDPRSLFHKGRVLLENLPIEFRGGWDAKKHAPHMRILFPETGASIIGEAGDNIGRGATTSLYILDEAAFIERPHLVEASLSQTTNCRIDISTPNGMGNVFAEKRHSGKVDVFTFNWRDDPRKDDAWYEKQRRELDPVTLAQEVDIDYSASVEGVVIPAAWVTAAIDAHIRLGIAPSGIKLGALDVADQGKDMNAYAGRHGILLNYLEEWSGKTSTLYKTAERACELASSLGHEFFRFDSDGLGAAIRGDVMEINKKRSSPIKAEPFRGSESVANPDKQDVAGRKNVDFFQNNKAQSWWQLRLRFERTYNWVVEGTPCAPDDIISIDSRLKLRNKLVGELSQPTFSINQSGKVVIDKAPNGRASPNLADTIMMTYSNAINHRLIIPDSMITNFNRMGLTRRNYMI